MSGGGCHQAVDDPLAAWAAWTLERYAFQMKNKTVKMMPATRHPMMSAYDNDEKLTSALKCADPLTKPSDIDTYRGCASLEEQWRHR